MDRADLKQAFLAGYLHKRANDLNKQPMQPAPALQPTTTAPAVKPPQMNTTLAAPAKTTPTPPAPKPEPTPKASDWRSEL